MGVARTLCLIGAIIYLTACTADFLASQGPPPPTPTFIVAEYATPTEPLPPTATSPIEAVASPTPEARQTPTPTRQATAAPGVTPEPDSKADSPEPATEAAAPAPASPTHTPPPTNIAPTEETAPPTPAVNPTPTALRGRIAFPVDDGGGYYDVWVIDLPPEAPPFLVQKGARQPNFSGDGRLLVKMQGSDLGESIGLLDANYAWQGILNESPEDSYPFWSPDNTRYTYSNSNLVKDPDTAHLAPYIFTACSLQIPRFESDIKCQDTRQWGSIEVGDAPVWTADDRLVFFTYKGDDGLYFVESASVLRAAGGLGPKQLLIRSNGRPTDTAGSQIFFSAGDIDGNWEAYAIDLDGSNLTNLSQSPDSQDGLPTVSPDGNWVAFVSDRAGGWGLWVTPRTGGPPTKIVDLSQINSNPSPWGTADRAWMMERISWGPTR